MVTDDRFSARQPDTSPGDLMTIWEPGTTFPVWQVTPRLRGESLSCSHRVTVTPGELGLNPQGCQPQIIPTFALSSSLGSQQLRLQT